MGTTSLFVFVALLESCEHVCCDSSLLGTFLVLRVGWTSAEQTATFQRAEQHVQLGHEAYRSLEAGSWVKFAEKWMTHWRNQPIEPAPSKTKNG